MKPHRWTGYQSEWHTSSLTRRAEHCKGTPIILCGFHVTELALRKINHVKSWHHDKLRLSCAQATELWGSWHCFSDARKTLHFPKNQQIYILFSFPWKHSFDFQGGLRAPPNDWDHIVQGPLLATKEQNSKHVKELLWCRSPLSLLLTQWWPGVQSHGSFHCWILTFPQPSFSFFWFNWLSNFSYVSFHTSF